MTDDFTYIKNYSVEKIGKVETSQLDKVVVIKNNQFIQRSNPPAQSSVKQLNDRFNPSKSEIKSPRAHTQD